MFGLSMKERCREALERDANECLCEMRAMSAIGDLELNQDGYAYWSAEFKSQGLYALKSMFKEALGLKRDWASDSFFYKSIGGALKKYEKNEHHEYRPYFFSESATAIEYFMLRIIDIEEMSEADRSSNKHFLNSADIVYRHCNWQKPNILAMAISESLTFRIREKGHLYANYYF